MNEESAKPSGNRIKSAKRLLKPAISAVLLIFLLIQIDLSSVIDALASARWSGLWSALGLFILGIFIRAYRWQIFIDALGFHVPLRKLSAWYFVGGFFNTVLPTGFGGDAIKAAELASYTGRAGEAVGTVVVDRFLGIVVLLAMGGVALLLAGDWIDPWLAWFIVLLFLGSLAGFWLLRRQNLMRQLSRLIPERFRQSLIGPSKALYTGLQGYDRRTLAAAFLISFIFNVTWVGVNILLGGALGIEATLIQYLVFVPLVSLSLLVPSVGGLGVRELTYVGLFSLVGVPEEQSFALGILIYAVTVLTGLIGGVIYLVQGAKDYRLADKQAADQLIAHEPKRD